MTKGNINYSQRESEAIIEEVYNTLKSIEPIKQFILEHYKPYQSIEKNMQNIEKRLDFFINADAGLQVVIASIYHRRNIMIPMHHGTEKNESIDAKKRLIKEVLELDKHNKSETTTKTS